MVSSVDTGIDLVATLREPQGEAAYVAIQCKFYCEHSTLSMRDLATFLSVSNTPFFASRLLFATNRGLNSHAQKQVANQEKPLQIISLETLRQFPVDWAQFIMLRVFEMEEEIKSTIIDNFGNRKTWQDWAQDVGAICTRQVELINGILNSPDTSKQTRQAFALFKQELIDATSVNLSTDDVV